MYSNKTKQNSKPMVLEARKTVRFIPVSYHGVEEKIIGVGKGEAYTRKTSSGEMAEPLCV